MTIIKEFISFYLSFVKFVLGKRHFFSLKSIYKKIAFILIGNITSLILGVILMALLAYILSLMQYPKPIYSGILKHKANCLDSYILLSLFFGGILAPIIEELIFRLPLRYTKANFIIPIIALYLQLFVSKSAMYSVIDGDFMERFTYKRILIFASILLFVIGLINVRAMDDFFNKIINSHGWWFYFSISVLFGILHTEPSFILENIPWLITQGAPQIAGGLYLGYIRLSYGIKYSILAHSILNLSLFVFAEF